MRTLTPRVISQDDFNQYQNNWQQLMSDPNAAAKLPAVLLANPASDKTLLNYTYLPQDLVNQMYDPAKPVTKNTLIQAVFVLAPDTDGNLIFSLVLTRLDPPLQPTYYLTGIDKQATLSDSPATLNNAPVVMVEIPEPEAASWITSWNNTTPGELYAALFMSDVLINDKLWPLFAYTFTGSDFLSAWENRQPGQDAIWLNFDRHNRYNSFNSVFGLVVTANTSPSATAEPVIHLNALDKYYDLSKPCPPACSAFEFNWMLQ